MKVNLGDTSMFTSVLEKSNKQSIETEEPGVNIVIEETTRKSAREIVDSISKIDLGYAAILASFLSFNDAETT